MSDCFQASKLDSAELCARFRSRKADAEPTDLGDARLGSSPVRWYIDQSWTAHKSRGGAVVFSAGPLTLTSGCRIVMPPSSSGEA